jgi:hypothetical protein
MSIRSTLTQLGVAAVVALGVVAAMPEQAMAGKNFVCRMKGQWLDNPNDTFEFDAAYVYNNGEDDFKGVYDNPGQAKANIDGAARKGIWNILLTYTDPKHQNMFKKLVGKGEKDRATHEIVVKGDYKTFIGTNDIKHDGQFLLHGKCK